VTCQAVLPRVVPPYTLATASIQYEPRTAVGARTLVGTPSGLRGPQELSSLL
jgi:hypothetical protein